MTETLLGPGESWRPTALSSVNEIVASTRGTSEDLNWTIERLYELARDQKTTELTRVLKQAVRSPTTEVDEPVITTPEDASVEKHRLS
jgi:methylthioribose-1-phosphate isomerase